MADYGQYYGFKANEDAEIINWGEVARGLGDQLKEEAQRREDKKAEIDKASKDLSTFISDTPLGGHAGAVSSTMDLASQAQEMRLMQDRMLKSGEVSLRDYNTMRGNLTQDVEMLYSGAKQFQSMYDASLERSQSGVAALEETWRNSQLEGFFNPSNTKYRFDPKTGQLMMGKLNEKGELVQSSFMTVPAINNSVRSKVDALNVPVAVGQITKLLPGKFKQAVNSGDIKSIEGVVNIPKFQEALNAQAEALITNPSKALSVLTNHLGEYGIDDFTTDPKQAGEDKILMIPNPGDPSSGVMIPQLTKVQEEKALNAIKDAFYLSIGYKEEARTDRAQTPGEYTVEQLKKSSAYYQDAGAKLTKLSGDDFSAEAKSIISRHNKDVKKGQDKLTSLSKDGENFTVVFEDKDGNTRTETLPITGVTGDVLAKDLANLIAPKGVAIDDAVFEGVELNIEEGRGELGARQMAIRPVLEDGFATPDGKGFVSTSDAFKNQKTDKAVELTNELLSRNFSNVPTSTEEIRGTKNILLKIGDLSVEVGYNKKNTRVYLNDLQEIFNAIRKGDTEGLESKYKITSKYKGKRTKDNRGNNAKPSTAAGDQLFK